MSESIIQQIDSRVIGGRFKLPVFNQVAMEVRRAVDADASIADIEAIIRKDPALASEVLKVANSAFFAGLAKQQTVRQALARLGLARVSSLVAMAAQERLFDAEHPYLAAVTTKLWQHAVASAGGCHWLAKKSGHAELAETAFLAGLLHDLGSLIIVMVLDEICASGDTPDLSNTLLLELIDSLHTRYGHLVMEAWQLPAAYALIARDHHLATPADGDTLVLHQMVRLVDAGLRKIGVGLETDPDLVLAVLPEALALGIKEVHVAELEIELEDMIAQFG